jgi:hypothetical protein
MKTIFYILISCPAVILFASCKNETNIYLTGSDNIPPSVTITSPANNSIVKDSVSITVSATDNVGVQKVEIYIDNGLVATRTSSPWVYKRIIWPLPQNSMHKIQARASDAAGNIGTSQIVTVFVLTDTSDIVFPPSNVSYGKYVQPLFLQECAIPGCHTQDAPAGNLSLESYGTWGPLIIIPKDTVNSSLVWSIEAKNGQPLMPPKGTDLSLTINQINGLNQWIYEGAKDN